MLLAINSRIILPDHEIWSKLENTFQVKYINAKDYSRPELIEIMKPYDKILLESVPISREDFDQLDKLKYLGILSTGYNLVDVEVAKEKGIVVTNIPSYGTEIVAQHNISLMMALASGLPFYNKLVREGRWRESKSFYDTTRPLIELKDKTLGILGYGNIGKRVGEIGRALGMDIIFYDKADTGLANQKSLDQIFAQADVISLNLPLNEETKEIINEESIGQMKDRVIIVNTARGGLINEEALAKGLESGKVYGAGLDVCAKEPINLSNPLLEAPNLIITPHIAWAGVNSRSKLLNIGYDNLMAYLDGEIQNQVNK